MPEETFCALSEKELSALEKRFGLVLPEDYRTFCQAFPMQLTHEVESGVELATDKILADYDSLIVVNNQVRNPNLWYFGEHPWPSQFFVIGIDGCGDHYFLDTSGEHPGILYQDINSWDIEHIADSMHEFAYKVEWGYV